MRRVAITGIGLASPLGCDLTEVAARVRANDHGIAAMPEWNEIGHLATRVAAPVAVPKALEVPHKAARTMGRVSQLATIATTLAVRDAGLTPGELTDGTVGLAYGSTHGSWTANEEWVRKLVKSNSFLGMSSTTYLKFMSHTTAANLAIHFGIRGRVLCTSAACVSATQAIGQGYETIGAGLADVMVCGGAEELHFSHAAVFDMLHAASKAFNASPELTPRPFDQRRDGLVVGEGAGTLVLESYDRAVARGAKIYAEITGFGTNCDGTHVTNPSADGMRRSMELALRSAGLGPDAIDYVNAHATATDAGDVAESQATLQVLGPRVPISSTKGHTGHTLGACGALESAFCLSMMHEGFLAPTLNLDEVDPRCAPLNYVRGEPRAVSNMKVMMNNNFAFGGINTSLIFGRV